MRGSGIHVGGHGGRRAVAGQTGVQEGKRKPNMANAWQEAPGLIWDNRKQLVLGLLLMLVSRGGDLRYVPLPLAPMAGGQKG